MKVTIGDGIDVDFGRYTVDRRGVPVTLSKNEWKLLHRLAEREGNLVMWEDLATSIWGEHDELRKQGIRSLVSRLRRRLEDDSARRQPVTTVGGLGYRLELHTEALV